MTPEQIFIDVSVETLTRYKSRILTCLTQLTPDQVWMRGSENENAVGNLVLHLCGNVRQWIGFGVGRKPDIRVRDREFSARGDAEVEDLKARLEATVSEAVEVISSLAPERLVESTRVQGYDVTVLGAIYHVVEHFSHHTGQIIFATKLFTGRDLGFYKHLSQPSHSERVP
jgi:uncharacterized damage-inducible protein DinB